MRRERCNRGRDGVPQHITTLVNSRGRGGGSFQGSEEQEGSVEDVGE